MKELIDGYRRFRANGWSERRRLFEQLSLDGQTPRALVIACADSRVDPQMIFDAAPGELFVVRNVANLAPPYTPDAAYHGTSAAIEFAVLRLQVEVVIVMGHERCGGVRALLDGSGPVGDDFVTNWMNIAKPARERAIAGAAHVEDRQRLCEQECIRESLANLQGFPWIAERAAAGSIRLEGCWFDIGLGELHCLDSDGAFRLA